MDPKKTHIYFFFIHVLNKSLKFIFASNEFKKPEKYIMKTYLSALFHILPPPPTTTTTS